MPSVTIIVSPRHTIKHDTRTYGAGDKIDMPDYEAIELIRSGAAHRPGEEPVFVPTVRPISRAELDKMPPGQVPMHHGLALSGRLYTDPRMQPEGSR